MSSPDSRPGGPVSVQARVLENRPAGAYRHLVLAADGIAQRPRPGHFLTAAVGGPTSGTLLRRAFSIHRVTRGDQGESDTVEIVVAAHAPGTTWLTQRREGDQVSVVGPLGRAFPLPAEPVACVLVGGGYGSAPLFWLAETLQQRGCRVDLVLGAATEAKLFGVKLAKYVADAMVMTTEDGSAGIAGRITDVLPEVVSGSRAAVIYACGPMGLLEAVSTIAAEHRAVAQVAVEEAMACGVGVCMTCVLPVRDPMGQTKMVRACVEGPVFRGERIRWDAFEDGWGRVPPDCLGAAGMTAYTVTSHDAPSADQPSLVQPSVHQPTDESDDHGMGNEVGGQRGVDETDDQPDEAHPGHAPVLKGEPEDDPQARVETEDDSAAVPSDDHLPRGIGQLRVAEPASKPPADAPRPGDPRLGDPRLGDPRSDDSGPDNPVLGVATPAHDSDRPQAGSS